MRAVNSGWNPAPHPHHTSSADQAVICKGPGRRPVHLTGRYSCHPPSSLGAGGAAFSSESRTIDGSRDRLVRWIGEASYDADPRGKARARARMCTSPSIGLPPVGGTDLRTAQVHVRAPPRTPSSTDRGWTDRSGVCAQLNCIALAFICRRGVCASVYCSTIVLPPF